MRVSLWVLLFSIALTTLGCSGTGGIATDPLTSDPPDTPPDAATVEFLRGDWRGFTVVTGPAVDALALEFVATGADLRVRVTLNGSEIATPFVAVEGNEIRFEAGNAQGDEASFLGTLDRDDHLIQGTFLLSIGSLDEDGEFLAERVPTPSPSATVANALRGIWTGSAGANELALQFFQDGPDLQVLVAFNEGFLGFPVVTASGNEIAFVARDHLGNFGEFEGTMVILANSISGTFTARIEDSPASGSFTVTKQP